MSNKVLFVATVDKGHILKFHIPYLKYFKEIGFEVHVACAGNEVIPYCDKKHELSFERSPYKVTNINAYIKLKKIIDENNFKLIHCHTPVGGMIGRLAARKVRKYGTQVLYTAHGFHFYKGAPLINWLLYYPIEKWLSLYTDCLITINEEDYQNSINYNLKVKNIKLVNGVGIDLQKFPQQTAESKKNLRDKYKYSEKDFILIYPADLNYNKNQDLLIDAVDSLKSIIPNIKLLLAGEGVLLERYKEKVKGLELEDYIVFLGYRDDINNLLTLSDVAVSASRREGLPVNIMEAMATGLPLVVTDCRGNRDLVINGENGNIITSNNVEQFATAIKELYQSKELRQKFASKSLEYVKKNSLENIKREMNDIYFDLLSNDLSQLMGWSTRSSIKK